MKKFFLLFSIILASQFNFAQNNTTNTIKLTTKTIEEYQSDEEIDFLEIQSLFIFEINGSPIIQSGEIFGLPHTDRERIVIFNKNGLSENHTLNYVSEEITIPIASNQLVSIDDINSNKILVISDSEGNIVSSITLK